MLFSPYHVSLALPHPTLFPLPISPPFSPHLSPCHSPHPYLPPPTALCSCPLSISFPHHLHPSLPPQPSAIPSPCPFPPCPSAVSSMLLCAGRRRQGHNRGVTVNQNAASPHYPSTELQALGLGPMAHRPPKQGRIGQHLQQGGMGKGLGQGWGIGERVDTVGWEGWLCVGWGATMSPKQWFHPPHHLHPTHRPSHHTLRMTYPHLHLI